MRLLLLRHAQTPANVGGILDTLIPGPGLTDLGREQAEAVAETLADEAIASITVSSMRRTALTAEPLAAARGLDVAVEEGLEEIAAGDLEGRSDRGAVRDYLAVLGAWGSGDGGARIPGGEDWDEFSARFDGAIARICARSDGPAVVVSHGAAIRTWVGGRSSNTPPAFAATHELDNTGVIVVEGDPASGWRTISWQGDPVGGPELADEAAPDPTGGSR